MSAWCHWLLAIANTHVKKKKKPCPPVSGFTFSVTDPGCDVCAFIRVRQNIKSVEKGSLAPNNVRWAEVAYVSSSTFTYISHTSEGPKCSPFAISHQEPSFSYLFIYSLTPSKQPYTQIKKHMSSFICQIVICPSCHKIYTALPQSIVWWMNVLECSGVLSPPTV